MEEEDSSSRQLRAVKPDLAPLGLTNARSPRRTLRMTTAHEREAEAEAQRPRAAAIYSKFRNRVMFPIANEAGGVIAFTGRTLATDEKPGPNI